MKKIYMSPAVAAIDFRAESMMAASPFSLYKVDDSGEPTGASETLTNRMGWRSELWTMLNEEEEK